MAIKPIIVSVIIIFLVGIPLIYGVNCNTKFYFYNFKFINGNMEYLGRLPVIGCLPGIMKNDIYKINFVKDEHDIFSYTFNPTIRFKDVIGSDNQISGGAELVKESKISIPGPDIDFDKISIKNDEGNEILSLLKEDILKKEQSEQVSFIDWTNKLIKDLLAQLFPK